MSNRAKSASRNSTEKNVGSGSKSSDFERRVAELAADIHLQMDTKMRTEKDKPSVGRKQEGGNQACAHERVQDEKNERVARVLSNEYKIYNRVKNQQQLLLLYLQHNFQLSFEEIAEVKVRVTIFICLKFRFQCLFQITNIRSRMQQRTNSGSEITAKQCTRTKKQKIFAIPLEK